MLLLGFPYIAKCPRTFINKIFLNKNNNTTCIPIKKKKIKAIFSILMKKAKSKTTLKTHLHFHSLFDSLSTPHFHHARSWPSLITPQGCPPPSWKQDTIFHPFYPVHSSAPTPLSESNARKLDPNVVLDSHPMTSRGVVLPINSRF